jgi:hypothetical protein
MSTLARNSGAAAVALMIFATALFAQNVKYDSLPGTDFSKYKTYKWQRADGARYPDQVTDQLLVNSIDEQLAAKGLLRKQDEPVDLYVVYQFLSVQDAELSSFTNDITWQGAGTNALPGFSGATTNSAMIVRKGWLLIDLYDTNIKKNVWQADAKKTLGNSTDPKKMEPRARKAMSKIFKGYPPSAK